MYKKDYYGAMIEIPTFFNGIEIQWNKKKSHKAISIYDNE